MRISNDGNNYIVLANSYKFLTMIDDETVDVCYMDPPFDLTKNYISVHPETHNVNFYEGEVWKGGLSAWILEMKKVFIEIKRTLKPTGSVFAHCDDQVASYLKIDVMDRLFKPNHFINQITWLRSPNTGSLKSGDKSLARNADTLYWYCKDIEYFETHNVFIQWPKEEIAARFPHDDNDGKGPYHWNTLTHLNQLEEKMKRGEIEEAKPGSKWKYRYKVYKSENRGRALHNVWFDINPVHGRSRSKMHYPTQKPEELIERIFNISCPEGATILDPYVGSGTSAVVARKKGFRYLVGDDSPSSIICTTQRIDELKQLTVPGNPNYILHKFTYSYTDIQNMRGYDAQKLIIEAMDGTCNHDGADGAIDGWVNFPEFPEDDTIVEVKNREGSTGREVVQKLLGLLATEKRMHGAIISHKFAKTIHEVVAKAEKNNGYKIKLLRISDILDITYPLTGTLSMDENFKVKASITSINERQQGKIVTGKGQVVNYIWQIINNDKHHTLKLIEEEGECDYSEFKEIIKRGARIKCIATDSTGESTIFKLKFREEPIK